MTYEDAIKKAFRTSRDESCVQHVNAILSDPTESEPPVILGYRVSDWFDGSTVLSYTNGSLAR